MNNPADRGDQEQVCPHLSLIDDPATALFYPSQLNLCSHTRPVKAANRDHQEEFCLTDKHIQCAVYQKGSGSPMPADLVYHRQAWERSTPGGFSRMALYGFGAVAIIVLIAWVVITKHPFQSGGNQGQATKPAVATLSTGPGPAASQSIQPESSSTAPPSSTFTLAAAPASAHTLETPIAPEQLVIHKLTEGESLESVARHFNTTVEAIRAANYNLKLPVWADSVIVIPANRVDMTGMPSFSAYQVTDNITIENLAAKLSVDAGQLIYYNGLSSGIIVTTGEWLVIPRPSGITPTKTP